MMFITKKHLSRRTFHSRRGRLDGVAVPGIDGSRSDTTSKDCGDSEEPVRHASIFRTAPRWITGRRRPREQDSSFRKS